VKKQLRNKGNQKFLGEKVKVGDYIASRFILSKGDGILQSVGDPTSITNENISLYISGCRLLLIIMRNSLLLQVFLSQIFKPTED